MNGKRSRLGSVRQGLAGTALAIALTIAAGGPAAARIAARIAAPAAAAASAAASARTAVVAPPQAASSAECPASAPNCTQLALQLRYVTVPLPAGRQGEDYKRRRVVSGGMPPYQIQIVQGELPPGLTFSPDGSLQGRPEPKRAPRNYEFTLEVRDASAPAQTLRQHYQLYVAAPRPTAKPKPAAPPPLLVRPDEAEQLVSRFEPGRVTFYKLTADDLEQLAPAPGAPAAADSAPVTSEEALPFTLEELQFALQALGLPPGRVDGVAAEAAAAPPTALPLPAERPLNPTQLHEMLRPLVEIEYPTKALFEGALRGRQCLYWKELVKAAAARQARKPPALDCVAMAAAARDASPRQGWTLKALFDSLLPQDVHERAVVLAEEVRQLGQTDGLQWRDADCGCVRSLPYDIVYAIFPFWRASAETPAVDFSRFHRISLLGVQFDDHGVPIKPQHWDRDLSDFVRTARRHDTRLDLVVHRNEWASMLALAPAQRSRLAERAARAAVDLVDTPLHPTLLRPLLPFWDEPRHAFDGLTVMFEDSPREGFKDGIETFRSFFRGFVHTALAEMRKRGRDYTLNIAVPDQLLGREGAYRLPDLLEILDRAAGRITDEGGRSENAGALRSPIKVRLLLLLREPTTDSKKALRELIDRHEDVKGHRRIELLESIIVVAFPPTDAKLVPLGESSQFDDDITYYKWVFGGIGVWPLPVEGVGAGGAVLRRIVESDATADDDFFDPVCGWICTRRSAVRLAFEALVATTVLGLAVYLGFCRVRRWGLRVGIALWVLGLATLAAGAGLLGCDPQLRALRESNLPLLTLSLLLATLGLWYSFKPRVPRP